MKYLLGLIVCGVLCSFPTQKLRVGIEPYKIEVQMWPNLKSFSINIDDSLEFIIKPLDYKGSLILKKVNIRTNDTIWTKYFCSSDSIELRSKFVPNFEKDPTGEKGLELEIKYKCIIPLECSDSIYRFKHSK